MPKKRIIIWSLIVIIIIASAGIYYQRRVGADTTQTLVGTKLQLVDSTGAVVKQNIPLKIDFKATVRVCHVRKIVFWKISSCSWEGRNFSRVALTDNDGVYNVSAESYRPLTIDEAKIVVYNRAVEGLKRPLTDDEKQKLDDIVMSASKLDPKMDAQQRQLEIEKIIQTKFSGYTPHATGDVVTTGSTVVGQLITTAAVTGAAVAAGSAATAAIAGSIAGTAAASAALGTASAGVTAAIGAGTSTASAAIAAAQAQAAVSAAAGSTAGSVAAGASGVLNVLTQAAQWLFTTPGGWAVLAAVVILAIFSYQTTEKWFTLLSADVKSTSTSLEGGSTTLYFQKDRNTTSEKYVRNANLGVSLNNFDQAFYGQAADNLYAKFIASNTELTDADKANYKNLMAANVSYLEYARLHGYSEANASKTVTDLMSKVVSGSAAAVAAPAAAPAAATPAPTTTTTTAPAATPTPTTDTKTTDTSALIKSLRLLICPQS